MPTRSNSGHRSHQIASCQSSRHRSFVMAARLILSRYGPKGNAKAIPPIDRHNGERQLDQLIVGELLSSLFVN